MIELIAVGLIGMAAGGVIVHQFKTQIDADAAKVVAAFNTEMAAIKAAHTKAAVKAVAPTTTPTA